MAVTKAKSQVECRREYVKDHPEEREALADLQASLQPSLDAARKAMRPQADVTRNESPFADVTVAEAVEMIEVEEDASELNRIIASDSRKGVKDAAEKRLKELES